MHAEAHYAVITGGTGSLGKAIAAALQAPGWSIASPGSQHLDVRDAQAVQQYFTERPLDLLVCAAGVIRDAPLLRYSEEAWNEVWSVNYEGAKNCADAVLPAMLAKGAGHVIFISSYSACHPPLGQVAYASAKAALLGLVQDLAKRHGPANIRVNAILPGFLETRMTSTVTPLRRSQVLASHALGRFNDCKNVADFIQFLHHRQPHTSGQVFQLDSRVG